MSVKDGDKAGVLAIASQLTDLGFQLCGTRGTAEFLSRQGISVKVVNKVNEGRPHVVDMIKNNAIQLVINTSALGIHEIGAAYELRKTTIMKNICYFTTLSSARAGTQAIQELKRIPLSTRCLQESFSV